MARYRKSRAALLKFTSGVQEVSAVVLLPRPFPDLINDDRPTLLKMFDTPLNCAVLLGGGLKTGQVVGESDEKGAYSKSRPLTPQDLMATIFHVLGIDLKLQCVHPSGRPTNMIDDGKVIDELV